MTKRTNSFCSPGQTRIFQNLLLCVSPKPGWTTHTGQCINSAVFLADQSRSQRRINGEIARRDVHLHQWEVVYRCNFAKEDVLFRSRNALHTTINTSSNPPLPHTCTENKWRWSAPCLQREQKKESTRTRWCDTSLSEILCWPAGSHLLTDLQQITGAVQSPLMLQTLHYPRPKETPNHWT